MECEYERFSENNSWCLLEGVSIFSTNDDTHFHMVYHGYLQIFLSHVLFNVTSLEIPYII